MQETITADRQNGIHEGYCEFDMPVHVVWAELGSTLMHALVPAVLELKYMHMSDAVGRQT